VKIILFFTVLINITFFLWEYRKGAPEIYLPAVIEYSTANAEKIVLLDKQPALHKHVDSHQKPLTIETEDRLDVIEAKDISTSIKPKQINKGNIDKLSACYQLIDSADINEILTFSKQQSTYRIAYSEQEVPYINNYLVLTLPAESLEQAKSQQEAIIQHGISDLWLFEKGGFKWRVSLGLFNSLAEADFARQEFTKLITQGLVVEPNWKKHTVTQVSINAPNTEAISTFEQRFSHYFDSQADCVLAKQKRYPRKSHNESN